MPSRLPELEDDGLITPEVGEWGEDKYRLVNLYCEMFTKSMKGKWGSRVYIDLFSGAGRARIRETGKIVPASPLLALSVANRFDRYIFCELDDEKYAALEARVRREYPDLDVHFVHGDTNKNIDEIKKKIPQHYPGFKVLSFCFVDPFSVGNLDFNTIRSLTERRMDFLVLIPSGMDASRNQTKYLNEENRKIDRFLGMVEWREEWDQASLRGVSFERFIREQFGRQMARLGYIYTGVEDMKPVRLTGRNVLLYRLALFSKSDLAQKFWAQACKYGDDQRSFF